MFTQITNHTFAISYQAEKIDNLSNRQKDDSQFLKDLLMSLMTSAENRQVFGKN